MTQKQFTQYVDDQDGSAATTKIFFAMAGVGYETDLSTANAARFAAAMEPWIKAARKSATGLHRPVQLVSQDVPETAVPATPAPSLPRRRRASRTSGGARKNSQQLQAV